MAQLFFNNARAVLNVGIDTLATSITLTDVVGLPTSLASGDWFLLTIYKDSRQYGEDHEVVKVTSVIDNGDGTLTCDVVRGMEMEALTHVMGERVESRLTAATVQEMFDRPGALPIGTPDWPVTLDYNTQGDLGEAVYAQGADRYRQSLTYNAEGDLATVLYEESGDGGTAYTEIGIETLHYDAEGNLTHTEWTGA